VSERSIEERVNDLSVVQTVIVLSIAMGGIATALVTTFGPPGRIDKIDARLDALEAAQEPAPPPAEDETR